MTTDDDDYDSRETRASSFLGRLDERTLNLTRTTSNLALALKELQISQRLDTEKVLKAIDFHADEEDKKFNLQDVRIKSLENWKWYVLGVCAALFSVVGIIWEVVKHFNEK